MLPGGNVNIDSGDGTHPEALCRQAFWQPEFDYLHENPSRKGLVFEPADWRFSSAAYWLRGAESEVLLMPVEW